MTSQSPHYRDDGRGVATGGIGSTGNVAHLNLSLALDKAPKPPAYYPEYEGERYDIRNPPRER